jgi:uncharacterized protein (DUF302 family)
MGYGISIRVQAPFAEAADRVRDALKAQGFGVLTEIDMRATLRDKLDEDMEDYLILGAYNPPLSHRALGIDASVGLLLPCNVVVHAEEEHHHQVAEQAGRYGSSDGSHATPLSKVGPPRSSVSAFAAASTGG